VIFMSIYKHDAAEREANKIGEKFMNSNDIMGDMSRAYNVDFSDVKIHTDSAADSKVKSAGKDAIAQGNEIFFGKGIFESNDPADKGLVAHELAHTMQQGVVAGAVAESAPMGAAQGGIRDWFRRKKKNPVSNPLVNENKIPMASDAPYVYTSNDAVAELPKSDEYRDMARQIMALKETGDFSAEEISVMLREIGKAKRASME